MKPYGQIAYEAYAEFAGLATGQPLPQWDALKPEIQNAWDEAAHEVIHEHGKRENDE